MSANYWENIPALTPLQFYKPYQPAYEEKLKTIQAQSAYWQQGAQQVNSILDKANQLSLITENKDRAQNFEKEADSKIVDITKNNLAVNGIASQALNVYAPLFNDVDIRQEDGYVKNENSTNARNDSEKNKNGGIYYDPSLSSTINGKMAVMKNYNKKDAWKLVDGTEYTPYYDKAKEDAEFSKNNTQNVTVRDELAPLGTGVDKDGKSIIDGSYGTVMQRNKNADIDYLILKNQREGAKSDKYRMQEKKDSDAQFWSRAAVLNGNDLASIYSQKAKQTHDIDTRYINLGIAQDDLRMSRFKTDEEKQPLQKRINAAKENLSTIDAEYKKNLTDISQMNDISSKIPSDLNIYKRLNFLANNIDYTYNNTQFALNNSHENNSVTLINAPENFQIRQKSIIDTEKERIGNIYKLQQIEAGKDKSDKEGSDGGGKGNNNYETLFGDGRDANGNLTQEALRFNQGTQSNSYPSNKVAPSIDMVNIQSDGIYKEQKSKIQEQDVYKQNLQNLITSGLFSDNKGLVTQLTSTNSKPENIEPGDVEKIRDKFANIAYSLDQKAFGAKGNSLEAFKNSYKNLSNADLIKQYNKKLNDIILPDENGIVNPDLVKVLSQGLDKDKHRDLSNIISNAATDYKEVTIKNLQLVTDAIKKTDINFYNYERDNGKLTEGGRLRADTVDDDLKRFYTKKVVNYGNGEGGSIMDPVLSTDLIVANPKPLEMVNAIKKAYYDAYSPNMENTSSITYNLENRNAKNGKGVEDDVTKNDGYILQKQVSKLVNKASTFLIKNNDGTYTDITQSDNLVSGKDNNQESLGDIIKKSIQTLDAPLKSFTIAQGTVNQDGKDRSGNPDQSIKKELTLTLNFNNLLSKPSALRNNLESAGYIQKDPDGKTYSFLPKYKNLNTPEGLLIKINEDNAAQAGMNPDFFQKKSNRSIAVGQTGIGEGMPIYLFDRDGTMNTFKIKNLNTAANPQYALIDPDKAFLKLGKSYTPDNIISGLMKDLTRKGVSLTSKTIGDNIFQRITNKWYHRLDKLEAPTTLGKTSTTSEDDDEN